MAEKELLTKWLRDVLLGLNNGKILISTLLYDSERDGVNGVDYKDKCCHQSDKLVIAQTEYDHIVGGFISPSTNSFIQFCSYKDENAFPFLLRSKFNNHKPKICRIKPEKAGFGTEVGLLMHSTTNDVWSFVSRFQCI